jgi:hypothetical protein
MTEAIVAVCDPIRRRTSRYRQLDRVASRLFPSACYYQDYPGLSPDLVYSWNELDTHDGLTDWFKHFRSLDDVHACLTGLGFSEIVCAYAGNGVEARARSGPEITSLVDSGRC